MHTFYVLLGIFIAKISCDSTPNPLDTDFKYLSDPKKEVPIEVLELPSNCTRKSKKGDILTTDYVGYFPNGEVFDSTYKRNDSMMYTMGGGSVIKGAEIGTMNMCKGEKRKITIPPNLGYGDKDYGQIPANSTLMFDIVLTDLMDDPFMQFDSQFMDFQP